MIREFFKSVSDGDLKVVDSHTIHGRNATNMLTGVFLDEMLKSVNECPIVDVITPHSDKQPMIEIGNTLASPRKVKRVLDEYWVLNRNREISIYSLQWKFKGYWGKLNTDGFMYGRSDFDVLIEDGAVSKVVISYDSYHRVVMYDYVSEEVFYEFGDGTTGIAPDGKLHNPNGVTFVPTTGDILITVQYSNTEGTNTGEVVHLDIDGVYIASYLARVGAGYQWDSEVKYPYGIEYNAGKFYVFDSNSTIGEYELNIYPPNIDVSGSNIILNQVFTKPRNVTISNIGIQGLFINDTHIYATCTGIKKIVRIDKDTGLVDMYSGFFKNESVVSSSYTQNALSYPTGILLDDDGRIVIADYSNNSIRYHEYTDLFDTGLVVNDDEELIYTSMVNVNGAIMCKYDEQDKKHVVIKKVI